MKNVRSNQSSLNFRVGHCHRQLIGMNMYITKFRKLSKNRYIIHMLRQKREKIHKLVVLNNKNKQAMGKLKKVNVSEVFPFQYDVKQYLLGFAEQNFTKNNASEY